MKKVNINNVIAAQEKLQAASKAKKARFYQMQRELYGAEIDLLRDEQPHLSLWEATQIIYNAHKYNVDKNTKDFSKEIKWAEFKEFAKQELNKI